MLAACWMSYFHTSSIFLAHARLSMNVCEQHASVQALHTAGLVHRDIKPMNIIYAEQQKRFKLIDLGACADLRSGTNYIPDESILDPTYCPPEQVQQFLTATHVLSLTCVHMERR